MRTAMLALILGLPVVAIGNAVVFGLELGRFLASTPRLASTRDLEDFKRVVARQMYAALAQIVLLALPPVLFGVGLATGVLGPDDVLTIVIPAAAVILVAAFFKRHEHTAKNLPATDPELERARDAIVRTWHKRPVPDW